MSKALKKRLDSLKKKMIVSKDDADYERIRKKFLAGELSVRPMTVVVSYLNHKENNPDEDMPSLNEFMEKNIDDIVKSHRGII